MLYDFNTVLKNEDGTDAIDGEKPATMSLGAKRALIADGSNLTPAKKLARFELFSKLAAARADAPVELTADEVSLLKDAVEIYPTLVYGQFVQFLNQKNG